MKEQSLEILKENVMKETTMEILAFLQAIISNPNNHYKDYKIKININEKFDIFHESQKEINKSYSNNLNASQKLHSTTVPVRREKQYDRCYQ